MTEFYLAMTISIIGFASIIPMACYFTWLRIKDNQDAQRLRS